MNDNQITSFSDEYVSEMKNLKWLILNNNRLTRVPRIQRLQLDYLYLHSNKIELHPGDFDKVSIKEDLFLSDNSISTITPLLDLRYSPKLLRLQGNNLSKVTASELQRLIQGNLTYLYINNCNLTTFPDIRNANVIIRSDNLGFIEHNNDFSCDCRMYWMVTMRQLQSQGRELGDLDDWKCSHPAPLSGRKMLDEVLLKEFCPGRFAKYISENFDCSTVILPFLLTQDLPFAL
jgi:hypothetical protein